MKKGFYHDLERLQEKMTIQDLVRLIPGWGLEVLLCPYNMEPCYSYGPYDMDFII